jgi:hypothetical protein
LKEAPNLSVLDIEGSASKEENTVSSLNRILPQLNVLNRE